MQFRRLWIALGLVMTVSFAVLGGVGYKALQEAPPVPSQVVTADGRVLFDGETIQDGQNVWQSIGGQEVGSILGSRLLRCSRLDRRLAAPRVHVHPGSLGAAEGGTRFRYAPRLNKKLRCKRVCSR